MSETADFTPKPAPAVTAEARAMVLHLVLGGLLGQLERARVLTRDQIEQLLADVEGGVSDAAGASRAALSMAAPARQICRSLLGALDQRS